MKNLTKIIFFLLAVSVSGFAGAWIGQIILMPKHGTMMSGSPKGIHELLHDELSISAQQEVEIADIEKEYKRLKSLYRAQMKAANMELAQAIQMGGYEAPEIEAIVHKIHGAMGALQALSLKHLADMQKILTEDQNKKLREMVVEQLQHNAGE